MKKAIIGLQSAKCNWNVESTQGVLLQACIRKAVSLVYDILESWKTI
jgi:hypothetical protein